MQTIYKYAINILCRENRVKMPENAQILSIQMQGQYPCIWALVETENVEVERLIEVLGTGNEMRDLELQERTFIATVQFLNGLVFHFFELTDWKDDSYTTEEEHFEDHESTYLSPEDIDSLGGLRID